MNTIQIITFGFSTFAFGFSLAGWLSARANRKAFIAQQETLNRMASAIRGVGIRLL